MFLVTDEQLKKEVAQLENTNIKQAEAKVVDIKRGRGIGRIEIPEDIRALVAEEAINGTPHKKISEAFGISPAQVSAYKNDATSTATYDKPDASLKQRNDVVRTGIIDSARAKLAIALDNITDEKLAGAKLKDVAQVAQAMSGIIKNMEPAVPQTQNNTQVIVYKPRQRDEDEFEIITVNE